ncbi:MAG: immunity 17 family protein [Cardiobacteriaceae bacterium]|nr:immunity 17 family protein [Cardiobacteriaceae bacterium]
MDDDAFLFIGGIYCLIAAFLNFDWFFEHYLARPFVAMFRRNGARVFYALLGILLLFAGIK